MERVVMRLPSELVGPPAPDAPPVPLRVTVVEVDMSVGSMVEFMLKWAVASIPAFMIIFAVGFVLVVIATAFVGAMPR